MDKNNDTCPRLVWQNMGSDFMKLKNNYEYQHMVPNMHCGLFH